MDKRRIILYNIDKGADKMANKSVRISSSVTEDEYGMIMRYCEEFHYTISWLIREALWEYMENNC